MHENDLPQIRQRLQVMYPNVDLEVVTATFEYSGGTSIQYADTYKKPHLSIGQFPMEEANPSQIS